MTASIRAQGSWGHAPEGATITERWLCGEQATQAPCLLTGRAQAEAIHLLHRKPELSKEEITPSDLVVYASRHRLDDQQVREGLVLLACPAMPANEASQYWPAMLGAGDLRRLDAMADDIDGGA